MKKLYCLEIFLLLYFSYFSSKLYSKEEITVLLEAHSTKNRNESCIVFNFKNIQKISNVEEKNQFETFSFPQDVTLEYSLFDHHWYLNKKKLKINNLILSASQEPYIEYKETKYDNAVKIIIQDDIIHLIHTTDLEDYVLSVVVHEIYPEWPDSALEAAAIAARTYAIYKKIEAEKRNKLFHIKSSQEHQRYNGLSENERVKKAVDKTKKKIITYNNNPILAMYHVCCGGVLPAHCLGYDFIRHPYLKRKKQCIGCESYKKYFWNCNITEKDFCKNLEKILLIPIKKIKKIVKTENGKSGAIRRLHILAETKKSKNFPIKLTNKQIRRIFNIKLSQYSSYFTVNKKQDIFEIKGRGHGHHIGLCQRGMFGYSQLGYSAEKILSFYYPGTTIIKYDYIDENNNINSTQ